MPVENRRRYPYFPGEVPATGTLAGVAVRSCIRQLAGQLGVSIAYGDGVEAAGGGNRLKHRSFAPRGSRTGRTLGSPRGSFARL